ncbi:hypothetical protein [Winogradskyella immobilis]|uniref:Uncharacterized protein n=1 Tax=Winogradskyella immobilis TaxID=2816852 RepID=A0ABS8EN86_9FLAO|nr:hypothetical protein [Winogradskyella immobilis]MCC1483762.1 hypothetical protein [Winogradskyella immobilis]MCG0015856.1 hypothetical protein [Winogradskyella immobilis]
MIGILLALQVNNWNEQRKEKKIRKELVASLIEDFEGTQEILSQVIFEADSLFNNMNTFYDLISKKTQITTVDSLRTLGRSFFRSVPFEPILSTYNEAKSTGNLNLIQSKAFTDKMTAFNLAHKGYNQVNHISTSNYFSGAMWDLRKTFGSSSILIKTTAIPEKNKLKPQISYAEYLFIVESPLGEAALENQYVVFQNMKNIFSDMDNAIKGIIAILKSLREEE